MTNEKLLVKYIKALIKSYGTNPLNGDTLQVHTRDIEETIKRLGNPDYKPTAMDIVWVNYFLSDKL